MGEDPLSTLLLDLIKKFKHIVSFYFIFFFVGNFILYFCKLNLITVIIQETRRFYFVFKVFVAITHFLIVVAASTGDTSSLYVLFLYFPSTLIKFWLKCSFTSLILNKLEF
jgi:hypothetical protein